MTSGILTSQFCVLTLHSRELKMNIVALCKYYWSARERNFSCTKNVLWWYRIIHLTYIWSMLWSSHFRSVNKIGHGWFQCAVDVVACSYVRLDLYVFVAGTSLGLF